MIRTIQEGLGVYKRALRAYKREMIRYKRETGKDDLPDMGAGREWDHFVTLNARLTAMAQVLKLTKAEDRQLLVELGIEPRAEKISPISIFAGL